MKIAIIVGIGAQYAIVDIVDYNLPLLDEPIPPSSDGSAGGTRAVEQLRLVMAELQVATVRQQVALSLFTDFEDFKTFHPAAHHEASLRTLADQLVAWGGAMKRVRETPTSA